LTTKGEKKERFNGEGGMWHSVDGNSQPDWLEAGAGASERDF